MLSVWLISLCIKNYIEQIKNYIPKQIIQCHLVFIMMGTVTFWVDWYAFEREREDNRMKHDNGGWWLIDILK